MRVDIYGKAGPGRRDFELALYRQCDELDIPLAL